MASVIHFWVSMMLIYITFARKTFTPLQAVTEIVVNGLDAAFRAKKVADITVTFWSSGTHPLCPNTAAITVTDNGVGFTDQVIKDYGAIGESVKIGHGRNGTGKLAALAASVSGPETAHYFIVTATGEKADPVMYRIGGDIIRSEGFVPTLVSRTSYPDLPQKGSFAQIVITNPSRDLTQDGLIEYLTYNLPITEWKVMVNLSEVPKRVLKFSHELELPEIDGIPGQVLIQMSKATTGEDGVWLMDRTTRRPVGLLSMQKAIRRKLKSLLLDPRLTGMIWVDDLEDWASNDREGLEANFWSCNIGRALIQVFNSFVYEMADEILDDEISSEGSRTFESACSHLAKSLAAAFGTPDIDDDSVDSRRPKTRNVDGEPEGHKGDGPGGGRGGSQSKKQKRRRRNNVYLPIDGITYVLYTFDLDDETTMPAVVRPGNAMVIATDHPDFDRLDKKNAWRELYHHMLRSAVMAHCHEQYGAEPDVIPKAFELLAKVAE